MTIRAIPTRVLNCTFRSRLEAKYALLFEALEWGWEYEVLDLESGIDRIPDFLMRFAHPTIIECKPAVTAAEISAYRVDLVRACADWLLTDVDRELRELDAAPDAEGDLARVDDLIATADSVRAGLTPYGFPGRRAIVAGSQLLFDRVPDRITIDGVHAFADGGDHVGLVDCLGHCVVCGRGGVASPVDHPLLPSANVLGLWRAASTKVQWRPPA